MASQTKAQPSPKKYSHPLDAVLDRPIAFHRIFVDITAGVLPALFLSQAWYWSKRHDHEDGWFFNTQADWQAETGLSRYEQESARKTLKKLGILEEKLRGAPARLYYRLNKNRIAELLDFQFAVLPQSGKSRLRQTDKLVWGLATDINKNPETAPEIKYMGAAAPARDDPTSEAMPEPEATPEQAIVVFPSDCQEGASLMHTLFKVIPPAKPAAHEKGSDFADWIKSIRALNQLAARYNVPLDQAFALTWADWNKNAFRVARPGALLKSMTAVLAKTKLREGPSAPAQLEAEQRLIVRNPFPRPASLPSSKPKRK